MLSKARPKNTENSPVVGWGGLSKKSNVKRMSKIGSQHNM